MTIQMSLLDYTPRPFSASPAADAAHQDHIHQRGEQYSCWKYGHAATYPFTAGAKTDSTSAEAAQTIEGSGRAELLRHRALAAIEDSVFGLTADEVSEAIGETVLATRPRISELFKRGLICDTGLRRKNISGVSAKVWRA